MEIMKLKRTSNRRRLKWLLFISCLFILEGCGAKSPVIPVTGKVTFANREQPEVCRLDFLPLESDDGTKLRPNGATLQPDGTFKMNEHLGVEGLLPGRYAVRVTFYDLKKGGDPNREGDWREFVHEAGELTVESDAGSVDPHIEVGS